MQLEELLREAGLTAATEPKEKGMGTEEQPPASTSNTSTALVAPVRFTQALAAEEELVRLALRTDQTRHTLDQKLNFMRRRVMRDPRDPRAPLLVKALIKGEPVTRYDRNTGKRYLVDGKGLAFHAYINVQDTRPEWPDTNEHNALQKKIADGRWLSYEEVAEAERWRGSEDTIEVRAVPHFVVDGCGGAIQYGTLEKSGEGWVCNAREHWCFVLRPLWGGKTYRLLPLGLLSVSRIHTWNSIAQGLTDKKWPTIEPIPHNLLGDKGARYLVYTPPGIYKFERNEDEKEAGRSAERSRFHYGHICGLTAIMSTRGGVPPFDDGSACTFTEPRVFLVKLEERAVILEYLGRQGQVHLLEGSIDLGELRINGFEALGLSPLEANPSVADEKASELAKGPYDMSNPFYAYAVGIGYIDPIAKTDEVTLQSLRRLGMIVADSLSNELHEMRKTVATRLSWGTLPELEEALAGKNTSEVFFRSAGEDVMADWIDSHIEGTYSWKCWLHRMVRQDLLAMLFKRNGVPIPQREGRRQYSKRGKSASNPADSEGKSTEAPALEAPAAENLEVQDSAS